MIRFRSLPSTKPPPAFVNDIVQVFEKHDTEISRAAEGDRFGSDKVLGVLRSSLRELGFEVEERIAGGTVIERPVFFGENGAPSLRYRVDAFNPKWECGLEIEAGRGLQGNAFYRDLVQAMVMTSVNHLVIAMLNEYRGGNGSRDYEKVVEVARAIYAHDRVAMPFGLTVVGYGPEGMPRKTSQRT